MVGQLSYLYLYDCNTIAFVVYMVKQVIRKQASPRQKVDISLISMELAKTRHEPKNLPYSLCIIQKYTK